MNRDFWILTQNNEDKLVFTSFIKAEKALGFYSKWFSNQIWKLKPLQYSAEEDFLKEMKKISGLLVPDKEPFQQNFLQGKPNDE